MTNYNKLLDYFKNQMFLLKEKSKFRKEEDVVEFKVSREEYNHYIDEICEEACKIFSDIIEEIFKSNGIGQKIKESDDYFQLITENANDLIAVHNDKFEYEYINEPVFKKILGYTNEDLIGYTNLSLIHPDDLKKTILTSGKILRKGEGFHELRFQKKNGNYKWLEVTARNFFNKRNEKKIITVLRDITERKQVEQKLKESEENNRLITENINDLIAIINPEFKCEYINEEILQKLLGYKSRDIIGKYILNFVHPEDIKESIKALREGEKIGEGIYTLRCKHKNGYWVWLEIKGKTFTNESGELKGLLIARDITERKQTEYKLKESEKKFRRIFESIPDIFFLVSDDSTILDYNVKEKDFCISPEKPLGKRLKNVLPEKLGNYTLNAIKKTINSHLPTTIEYSLPIKDKLRYFEARCLYFSYDRVAIFIKDITEREKANLIIREEFKRLKQLDEIRKNFVIRASHELKTPLVSINGATDYLLNFYQGYYDDEVRSLIETIYRGGKRLNDLIKKLIDVSRLESGNLKLKKQKENIKDVINKSVNEIFFLIKKRDLHLELNIHENLYLMVDKIQIKQVIINILVNAIKNTPPKGKISINLTKHNNFAEIVIKDTGVGLTNDEKKIIFQKFGKIERYGLGMDIDTEGTGLGLYISKEIVDLHGGQILVESKGRNEGSTFLIKLPFTNTN